MQRVNEVEATNSREAFMKMKLNIAGRRALVTGAGSGIGSGIAKVLAAEGVQLALSARSPAGVNAVADAIKAAGLARPNVVVADLTTRAGRDHVIDSAAVELGNVDMLINCAGGSRPFPPDANETQWEEAMTLNFSSMRLLAQGVIAGMIRQQWGRIINISGSMEPRGTNGANVAKGALHLWSKGLSCDLAKHGITVNCVAPGRINSQQVRNSLHPTAESREEFIRQHIPAGKFGEPEDVGHLVAFLCSPLAHYITGAVIPVDGGMHHFAH